MMRTKIIRYSLAFIMGRGGGGDVLLFKTKHGTRLKYYSFTVTALEIGIPVAFKKNNMELTAATTEFIFCYFSLK